MIPRPRFRMPLWAALATVILAYAVRSGMRGFDFRPDLPMDGVVLVALVITIALVAYVRRDDERRDAADPDDSEQPR